MSFQIFCAQCGRECGFIKNDNPKKEAIYGLCQDCGKEDADYGHTHQHLYGDRAKEQKK